MSTTAEALIKAASNLSNQVSALKFSDPVKYVYNPLDYAWNAHRQYLSLYGSSRKKVIFMGMNPGPFGMAQTGVPFGEVSLVRDWLKVFSLVGKPPKEHPKRLIEGFDCPRSEVSGKRLWGLFSDKFSDASVFFENHYVANYCPLVFLEHTGRNRTPDKLPISERSRLTKYCDQHLLHVIEILQPEWLVGVGGYAFTRLREVIGNNTPYMIGKILHPSPASPAANKDWAGTVTRQLEELGIW